MRRTTFVSTTRNIDLGDRLYEVGEAGSAEMCDIFCSNRGRGHIHLKECDAKSEKGCVKDPTGGRRHQTKEYLPNLEIHKDEMTHAHFWREIMRFEDPCEDDDQTSFKRCNAYCGHPSHEIHPSGEEKEAKENDDKKLYCVGELWHKPFPPNRQVTVSRDGHQFTCSHTSQNAHVVFLVDKSGSMASDDGGKNTATYTFIAEVPFNLVLLFGYGLRNRLGAVYSAMHSFITARIARGCQDVISFIPFAYSAKTIRKRDPISSDFVKNHALSVRPGGGTNFCRAFEAADSVIENDDNTILIFLTDGEDSESNAVSASSIVSSISERCKGIHIFLFSHFTFASLRI